jgi:rubrerythrin
VRAIALPFADLNDPNERSMLRGMVEPITDVEDLRRHLQWAIEVEHSTIPPYEYAMWSVVDPDSEAATSIRYVAREEMLHAALAANLLTAVGGSPRFTADAVPRYPEPMRHHDPKQPLVLHLAPASVELIRDVFLRIEQPEEPGAKPEADRYETLAQFYEAIVAALARLGNEVFTGDPRRQVTKGYAGHGGGALFAVTDLDSALLAIEVIVEQGEGTHTSAFAPVGFDPTRIDHLKLEPFGFQGAPEPAHYWRFLNIVEGRTALGGVHPMRLNPSTGDLPEGELQDLCRLFDACYSLQMGVMERVWRTGDESPLIDAAMVPLMNHAQKPIALALVREPWPDGSGEVAGPPFAWDPMPLSEMRELARRLGARFELGPTVETLDQVAAILP